MSGDEVFVLLASACFAIWAAWRWYARLLAPRLAARVGVGDALLGVAPPAGIVGVLIALKIGASYDVRETSQYLLLYVVLGTAWMFAAAGMLAQLGISFRDDAIERRNPAAAILVACAMAAHAAIYAGANIGDGPGWWCVVAAVLLGAGAWFLLWLVVEMACAASEQVTVERDALAAIRLGGYMIASGLICARGVAGDWTSLADTIADFWVAWPAMLLTAAAIGVERTSLSQPFGRSVSMAVFVAAAYVAIGVAAILSAPPLSQNPIYGVAP